MNTTGMPSIPKASGMSIQAKIFLAIVLAFGAVLAASMLLFTGNERRLAEHIGLEKAEDLAKSYFDGINTMMITGTLDQKETLRSKLLAQKGVQDVRILRAANVFPAAGGEVLDELDRQALNGKEAYRTGSDAQGRIITVVIPIKATANYLGTNCLTCHQTAEGTVVGATRIQYSLKPLDDEFRNNLLLTGFINLALSVSGILVVIWLLRRMVLKPLLDMRQTMRSIETDSDLRARLPVQSDDEVGQLANAFNAMLDKFQGSLAKVANTGRRVAEVAEQVSSVSRQTTEAASQQRAETDATRQLIGRLKDLAGDVGRSAEETAGSSVEADQRAAESTAATREAIAGILSLVQDMESAAEVIKRLDERSRNVSGVLEVIQGIAEQTNLLALNAAIEAARAGEAGRGFAVVADEVRNLASRSQESTRSIEEIVSQLQEEARRTVESMTKARDNAERYSGNLENAAASLDNIVQRVGAIRDLNTRMALAINKQGDLTDEAAGRVETISTIAGRTSSDAQHTQGVSEELVALARELNSLVNRFRVE